MRSPSRAFQQSLQMLRKSAADVTALADSIVLGGATNRHAAMRLIPEALLLLRARVEQTIAALEREGTP